MEVSTGLDKNKEYNLHFSTSGFGILLWDLIYNIKTYGAVDYVLLYEDDISRGYLSRQGLQEAYNIGAQTLDDEFTENLFKRSEDLAAQLRVYEFSELTSDNIHKKWEECIELFDLFCELYRFHEQPFQQALEEEILKVLSREELVDILMHENYDKLPDVQIKKYVARLIDMGHMKLRLHEASELLFTDKRFEEYVANKHGISVELAQAMRKNELVESFSSDTIPVAISELESRLRGAVFFREAGTWHVRTGEQYKNWKIKVEGEEINQGVKGNPAFAGIVQGRVVKHMSWTGTTDVQEGDIVVTGMTNPQMVPFLKKAGGIVTDEGGITCHAAIISRELKKPCIVGTQNATQVLNDGDLVEVDANEGIVRVLEHAKL